MLKQILTDWRVLLLIAVVVSSFGIISIKGIETGLDLQGGSIIYMESDEPITPENMTTVLEVIDTRVRGGLGVKDVKVRPWGDTFIIVEIAGVRPEDAESLIGRPGKLTVKVGNITTFSGGDLERIGTYTREPGQGLGVPFTITAVAAENFRNAALSTNFEDVYMYLDDELVNNAPIGESLREEFRQGRSIRDLILTVGEDPQRAREIEIILRSGALPVKLDIVGSSGVSPALGANFADNAKKVGVLVLIGVSMVVFLRYRRVELSAPILLTGFSEVVIILGVSSLIGHNIDLPSIAGIIASIGTGFDNQIVILDELLMEKRYSLVRRMKNAFFIVIGSWMTLMAAMAPLFLLAGTQVKGFAIIIILGATAGVFITRPAYARILGHILKTE